MNTFKKCENIVVEQVGEEYILYDSNKNTIFILNYIAYELWNKSEGKSAEKIIEELLHTCEATSVEVIGSDIIKQECEQMIEDFLEKGLLEFNDESV